jgi:hypothetical protein
VRSPLSWSTPPADRAVPENSHAPGKSGGEPAPVPYTILDSLPAEFTGPPLWDWHADAAWAYQITSVGERADQVEWLADRVRAGVVGRTDGRWTHDLRVPEVRVIDRELTYDAGGEPSVSAAGVIVSYVQRVTITVTPA